MIHPTAIIDPTAKLDTGVEIGPYSIVGADARIGADTVIGPHVTIDPYVTIGPECHIFQYASIGAVPQSVKFEGQKTFVKIGRGTIVREFVTIHRGTKFGGGMTEIGQDSFLMAYTHIAHDCKIGKNVIMANNATLAGHITIGDNATVGGLVAIHQFVRIGTHAFVGGGSRLPQDVPPYTRAAGNPYKLYGINTLGLTRAGFASETRLALKHAYRLLFNSDLPKAEAAERVRRENANFPEVIHLVDFVSRSERGALA